MIVNNNSSDASEKVIIKTLHNLPKLKRRTKYVSLDRTLKDIESWNKPLEYCKGKYIVVCEGDDWFEPDHLEKAANVLNRLKNIGLYVSCRADHPSIYKIRGLNGFCSDALLFNKLINFEFCPPPSELIFIRNNNGKLFRYDDKNYVYAGEYSLYYEILKSGLDGYINLDARTVNRGVPAFPKHKGYFHIKDSYYSFNKWQKDYSDSNYSKKVRYRLFEKSVKKIFIPQLMKFSVEKKLLCHLLSESKQLNFMQPLIILINSLFKKLTLTFVASFKNLVRFIVGKQSLGIIKKYFLEKI